MSAVVARRHRTGRERIQFADAASQRAGRGFLERLRQSERRITQTVKDFNDVGISFDEMWRFDNRFRRKDPEERQYEGWRGQPKRLALISTSLRSAAEGLRAIESLRLRYRGVRVDENFNPVVDDTGAAIPDETAPAIFAIPLPPSLRRKLPQLAGDLDRVAEFLESAAPFLRRPPHAPRILTSEQVAEKGLKMLLDRIETDRLGQRRH